MKTLTITLLLLTILVGCTESESDINMDIPNRSAASSEYITNMGICYAKINDFYSVVATVPCEKAGL